MIKLFTRVLTARLLLLIVISYFGGLPPLGKPIPALGESSTVVFYHNRSELYRNTNESAFIYENADLEPPLSTEATRTTLRCSIIRQVQYMFTTISAYVGLVEWIAPPLSEDYVASGTVTMYVWLSSDDVAPQISGYGMAVADLDENGNIVGDLFYNYKYVDGKVLSADPTEYSISVNINHVFPRDHKLAFEVIVGSTTQGWTAYVYFDSPERNSRAVLPGSALVPEFEDTTLALALATVAYAFFILRKKKC